MVLGTKRLAVVLLLTALACTALQGQTRQFQNKQGLSFDYPADVPVYSWNPKLRPASIGSVFVTVFSMHLPLTEEETMGYDNKNVQQIRVGLAKGIVDGFPFNYPYLCNVVKFPTAETAGIKSYRLSFFEIQDIQFEIEYILFMRDFLFEVRISADPFRMQIIDRYLGKYFERDKGDVTARKWIEYDSIKSFKEYMESNPPDPILEKLNETADIIYRTISTR